MTKLITSLKQAAELSLDGKTAGELNADIVIDIKGEVWHCYTVSISHRDILCYCNKGVATFVVDTYGNEYRFELFDWEKD